MLYCGIMIKIYIAMYHDIMITTYGIMMYHDITITISQYIMMSWSQHAVIIIYRDITTIPAPQLADAQQTPTGLTVDFTNTHT